MVRSEIRKSPVNYFVMDEDDVDKSFLGRHDLTQMRHPRDWRIRKMAGGRTFPLAYMESDRDWHRRTLIVTLSMSRQTQE